MPQVYPDTLDPSTTSPAERELYARFRDGLGDDYVVFHSVAWQSLDDRGRRCDGEADFVLAHPRNGILVLEVKGGTIDCDPRTGRWASTSASGRVSPIKNPFAQAKSSMYVLRDDLRRRLGGDDRHVNVGHAVAFPDVVVGDRLLGPDKPRAIVLDRTDTANVSRWVGQAMEHYRGSQSVAETSPGTRAMDVLVDLLGKRWCLRPALWGDFVREQAAMLELTEQQFQVLDLLSRHDRALVCGCAGSGKTLLAAEKACRLSRQGFRTLLTCYNKRLAAFLRSRLGDGANPRVVHFHELCHDLSKQVGTLPPEATIDERFFAQTLPECLLAAVEASPDLRFDAIVVDEGQDFQTEWWIPLLALLRDPDRGILYIFYDDNQRLYDRPAEFPIVDAPFPLSVNCRNTQAIHRQMMRFYGSLESPVARGPQGRPVEVVRYAGAGHLHDALASVLRRLMGDERVPADEIVVLTPYAKEKSLLWRESRYGEARLVDGSPTAPNEIQCATIHGFKGLERSVAIVAETEHWPITHDPLCALLYVACSRARNHLVVLLSDDAPPVVRQAFARAPARASGRARGSAP